MITITKATAENLESFATDLADALPNSTKLPGRPAVRLLSSKDRDLRDALNQLEQLQLKHYKIKFLEEDVKMVLYVIWSLSSAVSFLLSCALDFGGLLALAFSLVSGISLSIYWLWAKARWNIDIFS